MMVMPERAGKVYLVGSGPGDVAYLTLQAQAVLSQAEVVVYDALVDGALLTLVPDGCLKLDVGKRGGQPSTPQAEINQILVEYCQQGYLVVRLKNGDPFIYGRSQSEIGALRRANCDFEVVPGLSSSLLAPLMAGIPLTDPRLSNGFTVMTGHDPDSLNWVSLAKLETLVFLMGARTLPEIVRRLRGHGRSPDTPIAVIRYAGGDRQQVWEGTLADILELTANQSLSPCVIVIGEVVKLRAYIGEQGTKRQVVAQTDPTAAPEPRQSRRQNVPMTAPGLTAAGAESEPRSPRRMRRPAAVEAPGLGGDRPPGTRRRGQPESPRGAEVEAIAAVESVTAATPALSKPSGPLSQKTVLVTRAASQASQFTALLEEQGATVIEMPTLEIGPPSSWRDLDRAISHLEDFDWLVLTSANGVEYFFDRLEAVTGERAFSTNIKVAVVGEKTAKTLRRLGIPADFIPPDFVADALVATFPEPLSGLRILFPRVESGGREVLVKEFSNQGAKVKEVPAYESYCPTAIAPPILVALQAKAIDVVTFASSKTVRNFCQLLQTADSNWSSWLENACIASIGPQTSQTCQSLLGRVDVEAPVYTLDGLTQAIAEWATRPAPAEPEPSPEAATEATSPAEPTAESSPEPSPEPSPAAGLGDGDLSPLDDAVDTAAIASDAPEQPALPELESLASAEPTTEMSAPVDREAIVPALPPDSAAPPEEPIPAEGAEEGSEPEPTPPGPADHAPPAPSLSAPEASEPAPPEPVQPEATPPEPLPSEPAPPEPAQPEPGLETVIEMEIVPPDPDQEEAAWNSPPPPEPNATVPPPSARFAPVIDLEIVSAETTARTPKAQGKGGDRANRSVSELVATPLDSAGIPDPWATEAEAAPAPPQRRRPNSEPPTKAAEVDLAPPEDPWYNPVNGDPEDDSDSNW